MPHLQDEEDKQTEAEKENYVQIHHLHTISIIKGTSVLADGEDLHKIKNP